MNPRILEAMALGCVIPLHSPCGSDILPQVSARHKPAPGPEVHTSECGKGLKRLLTGHSQGSCAMVPGENSVKHKHTWILSLRAVIFSFSSNSKETLWFNLKIHKENMSLWEFPARVICQQEGNYY